MAVAAWVAVDLVADGAQVEFGPRAFTKTEHELKANVPAWKKQATK